MNDDTAAKRAAVIGVMSALLAVPWLLRWFLAWFRGSRPQTAAAASAATSSVSVSATGGAGVGVGVDACLTAVSLLLAALIARKLLHYRQLDADWRHATVVPRQVANKRDV
jgi:hypothetical protein